MRNADSSRSRRSLAVLLGVLFAGPLGCATVPASQRGYLAQPEMDLNAWIDERNQAMAWSDPRAQNYYWTRFGRSATQNPLTKRAWTEGPDYQLLRPGDPA